MVGSVSSLNTPESFVTRGTNELTVKLRSCFRVALSLGYL